MPPLLADLFAMLWLACWVPLVALVHELGHALCAPLAGYRLSSFGIGRGPVLFRWRTRRGTVLWVGRWFFAGGACVAVPRMPLVPTRAAVFHSGGIAAQGVLALALLALPDWWWVEAVARFNLLVAVWNLLPWRMGRVASDGWWLLRGRHRARGRRLPLPAQRPGVEGLAAFEADRGAGLGWSSATLMLRWMDLLVGRSPPEDLRHIEELPADLVPLAVVLEAERRRALGQPMVAIRMLDGLDAVCAGLDDAVRINILRDLGTVSAARARLALGDRSSAHRLLCRLAGCEGPVAVEAGVLALELALADGDEDQVRATGAPVDARLAAGEGWTGVDLLAAARALRSAARRTGRTDWGATADQAAARFVESLVPADRSCALRAWQGSLAQQERGLG